MDHGLCQGLTDAAAITPRASLKAEAQRKDIAVTGGRIEGIEDDGIISFKGIPFAAPPVAELRWKRPSRWSPGME